MVLAAVQQAGLRRTGRPAPRASVWVIGGLPRKCAGKTGRQSTLVGFAVYLTVPFLLARGAGPQGLAGISYETAYDGVRLIREGRAYRADLFFVNRNETAREVDAARETVDVAAALGLSYVRAIAGQAHEEVLVPLGPAIQFEGDGQRRVLAVTVDVVHPGLGVRQRCLAAPAVGDDAEPLVDQALVPQGLERRHDRLSVAVHPDRHAPGSLSRHACGSRTSCLR